MKLSFFSVLLLAGHLCAAAPMPLPESNDGARHVFSTNQENFLMDGKPVKIISGEMHYPRVPRQHWKDRFQRIKAMGMNTVCTYLFWNVHEPEPGKWDFSGNLDFVEFIKEAQKAGLWVIVRPGPYVCAEWEFGGFPGWLLKDEDLKVRSQDPRFLEPAMAYLKKVCSMLEPLQITKGGPIIMAQVENEYGSYGSDKDYVKKHLDVIRKELPGVVPFTSDGPNDWMIKNGTLPGVVPAMNFGGGAKGAFANLEKHKGKTPRINGEFWVGWFDHWGKPKNGGSTEGFNRDLKWMLENNVSPNLFMAHGGTSFGFMNGANWEGAYTPDVTNYDYGAPISENGTLTDRYRTFRQTIQDYYGDTYKLPEPPAQPEMMELPPITFTETAGMFSRLPQPVIRKEPVHMEALGQSLGFILYRTKVNGPVKGELKMNNMQDRAIVYVDGKRQGARTAVTSRIPVTLSFPPDFTRWTFLWKTWAASTSAARYRASARASGAPLRWTAKSWKTSLSTTSRARGWSLFPSPARSRRATSPCSTAGISTFPIPRIPTWICGTAGRKASCG